MQPVKRRKSITVIPELKGVIYQPNRIIHAHYHYTLIQERIFNYVMFYLQYYITRIRNGESIQQLEIFNTLEEEIKIVVPMQCIVPDSPSQYRDVRINAKSLASVLVKVPYKDAGGKAWHMITGLMSVHVPEQSNKRSNSLIIAIRKSVAEMLVDIEKKPTGAPQNYTSFLFEVTMVTSNKYLPRIYKYLCSWKEREYAHINLNEFKSMLGIQGYNSFSDFKNKILIPVQEELMQKADVWFDCTEEGFATRTNNQVETLHFRIITQEGISTEYKLWNNIWNLLKTHFRLSQTQCDQLRPGFEKHKPGDITFKIMDLHQRLLGSKDIGNPIAYVMKVLLKEFA